MGLTQPATKVWEIPEPQPAYAPPSREERKTPEPELVPAEPEREKVPVGVARP